ncbi:MAG: efflux RND transporter periplasmic adaptor subunit [Burkholderiales bacterium]
MPDALLSAPSMAAARRADSRCAANSGTALTLSGAVAAAVLLVCLGGCGPSKPAAGPAGAGGPGGGMQGPTVGVLTVQPGPVALTTELSGRLDAWRTAQVRARVSGIVQKRVFNEGSEVRAGQLLYQLDDGTVRAALASAQAQQARAEATLAQAQAQLTRNQPLVEQRAISQQEWVATQAALKQSEADLALTRAAVQNARINLDYAAIGAPIAGRIGRSQVTEGALVGPTDAVALATIQQVNPLYVNFTQPASEVLRLERAFAAGQLERATGGAARVRVVLDDGREYPLTGKLLFSEKSVDPTSGQVLLRAELPNPQGLLLPGLFVRVRLVQARSAQAVLLPQQAVTRAATGDTVLVVGSDRKVAPRQVKIGGSQGNQWVVEGGLAAGDQVVIDGFQKLAMAPGAPVNPVPWAPPTAPGQPGAAAPGAAASAPAGAAPAAASAAASR